MLRTEPKKSSLYSKQTSRLIKVIFDQYDGLVTLSEGLKKSSQILSYWRKEGRVPLERVGPLARDLGVPNEALNYEEYGALMGENTPWLDIIKSSGNFKDYELNYIKGGLPPKPYKKTK